MGAAMNTIPTFLTAELDQLRSTVAGHGHAIQREAAALEESRSEWASQDRDISHQMQSLQVRLAGLLKPR